MTFMARGSVPLNKASVFIERKDISLSNYSTRRRCARELDQKKKEKERKEKGTVRFRSQPYQASPLHNNACTRLHVDLKRVHTQVQAREGCTDDVDVGVGPGALIHYPIY